jgi:hypothetical protein
MHPALSYEIAKAHIADLHRQAQRDALASAVRQARRARRRESAHRQPTRRSVAARRVIAVLSARSAA